MLKMLQPTLDKLHVSNEIILVSPHSEQWSSLSTGWWCRYGGQDESMRWEVMPTKNTRTTVQTGRLILNWSEPIRTRPKVLGRNEARNRGEITGTVLFFFWWLRKAPRQSVTVLGPRPEVGRSITLYIMWMTQTYRPKCWCVMTI